MYVSTLCNILSSANQFVFLSKSICFPRQINLFCSTTWRLQPCWMTFSMTLNDVLDDAEWRWWLCNFNEFGQQIHWISSANSLKLVSKFIEFAELHDAYRYLIFYIPIGYVTSKNHWKTGYQDDTQPTVCWNNCQLRLRSDAEWKKNSLWQTACRRLKRVGDINCLELKNCRKYYYLTLLPA